MSDDEQRGRNGVLCSIRELATGKLRIVMDDLDNSNTPGKGPWMHRVLVTWKDYERSELEGLQLSEQEFASFGHYVLARLVAVHKTGA